MPGNWDDRAAFCLLCGAPLEVREVFGAPRKACTACDYVFFRPPSAAACAVIARGRELVLVRRGIRPYLGSWGFPGGFQEYDERPEQTAAREALEETGLEVRIARLLDVCYATDDPRKRVNVVAYLSEPVGGDLRAGDDVTEARYFPLDDLPADLGFENNRRICMRLLRDHPTGDIL